MREILWALERDITENESVSREMHMRLGLPEWCKYIRLNGLTLLAA